MDGFLARVLIAVAVIAALPELAWWLTNTWRQP